MASRAEVKAVRLLGLFALLLCIVQLHECLPASEGGKPSAAPEQVQEQEQKEEQREEQKQEEDKEQEQESEQKPEQESEQEQDRLNAARVAYKKLYVSSEQRPAEEVVGLLHDLKSYADHPDFKELPLSTSQLLSYNKPQADKCLDSDHLNGLSELAERTKSEFTALNGYLRGALERQLDLCVDQYKSQVNNFLRHQWIEMKLIGDFTKLANQHRALVGGDQMSNPEQMAEALHDLLNNQVDSADFEHARTLLSHLQLACKSFSSRLGFTLKMAALHPEFADSEQMQGLFKNLAACDLVLRDDFSKTARRFMDEFTPIQLKQASFFDW